MTKDKILLHAKFKKRPENWKHEVNCLWWRDSSIIVQISHLIKILPMKKLVNTIAAKPNAIYSNLSFIGTCVLFRTHSISEVRFFRKTNYDARAFYEKIRFHSHKDKTQFSLLRIVMEDSDWTWILKWKFGIRQRLKKRQLYFSRIRGCCPQ